MTSRILGSQPVLGQLARSLHEDRDSPEGKGLIRW